MHKIKNKRGFTLIELIVVFTIIGILATIAAINFLGFTSDVQSDADIATARSIISAVHMAESNISGGELDTSKLSTYLDLEVEVVDNNNIPDSGWAVVKDDDGWLIYKNKVQMYP